MARTTAAGLSQDRYVHVKAREARGPFFGYVASQPIKKDGITFVWVRGEVKAGTYLVRVEDVQTKQPARRAKALARGQKLA